MQTGAVVRRAAVPVMALAVLLPVTAGSAVADVRTFRDRAGDTGVQADVTRVQVDHGGPNGKRVVTATRVGNLGIGDSFAFFVSTRGRNRGPEYVTRVEPNAQGPVLRRIQGWHDAGPGSRVRCRGLKARANAFGRDRVLVSIPRSCLETPARVRIAVLARFEYPRRTVTDWAPRRRALFGPVRR